MRSLWMWAAITICGSFYVVAVAFTALGVAGIRDFGWVSGLKDFAPLLSAVALALSYVVGTLVTRLEQPFFVFARRHLFQWWLPSLPGIPETVESYRRGVCIWQYGSARLHHELDAQFGVLQLCKVMTLAAPALSMGIGFWLFRGGSWMLGLEVTVAGWLIGVGFVAAYKGQRQHFWKLLEVAHAELEKPGSKG